MARRKGHSPASGRGVRKKESVRKRRSNLRTPIALASAAKRARVFRAFRKVLENEGLSGVLASVHFDAPQAPGPTDGAMVGFAPDAGRVGRSEPCPPGQVVRIVCFMDSNGTVVCKPRCQPLLV
jgi:hypothetical protein